MTLTQLDWTSGLYCGHSSVSIREGDARLLPPGPGGPPPFGLEPLPERYGVAQLEFLVVDPHFVFIAWEITAYQLEQAQRQLGSELWPTRVLVARFRNQAGDALLAERELYGEQGRWFIDLRQPGKVVKLELGYRCGVTFHLLAAAGPLQLPRLEPIEPDQYAELRVSYGTAEDGSLVLLSIGEGHGVPPMGLAPEHGPGMESIAVDPRALPAPGWSDRR